MASSSSTTDDPQILERQIRTLIRSAWKGNKDKTNSQIAQKLATHIYTISPQQQHRHRILCRGVFATIVAESVYPEQCDPQETTTGTLAIIEVLKKAKKCSHLAPAYFTIYIEEGLFQWLEDITDEDRTANTAIEDIVIDEDISADVRGQFHTHQVFKHTHFLASKLFQQGVIQATFPFANAMQTALEMHTLPFPLPDYLRGAAIWIKRNQDKIRDDIESGDIKPYPRGDEYAGIADHDTIDRKRWNWWRDRFLHIIPENIDREHRDELSEIAQGMDEFTL